jgi:hypothetical protein
MGGAMEGFNKLGEGGAMEGFNKLGEGACEVWTSGKPWSPATREKRRAGCERDKV